MRKREMPKEYDLLKIKCDCGRCFYMALSRRIPAKFGFGTEPDEAMEKLIAKLREWRSGKLRIPDFLPPDI